MVGCGLVLPLVASVVGLVKHKKGAGRLMACALWARSSAGARCASWFLPPASMADVVGETVMRMIG